MSKKKKVKRSEEGVFYACKDQKKAARAFKTFGFNVIQDNLVFNNKGKLVTEITEKVWIPGNFSFLADKIERDFPGTFIRL